MWKRSLSILTLLALIVACGPAEDGASAAAADKQASDNAPADPEKQSDTQSATGEQAASQSRSSEAAKAKTDAGAGDESDAAQAEASNVAAESSKESSKEQNGSGQGNAAWPAAAQKPTAEKSAPATDGTATQSQVKAPESAAAVFDSQFRSLQTWQQQSLSKWKGQYIVLNFWATWCKSCQHEVPELDRLYDKFKDDNAVVVGIAIDNADKVKKYLEKYDIDYPVLVGGEDALALSKEMGNSIEGLPYTIVITPEGKVVEAILGATEKGTLPRVLTPILKQG